jgi:hypothetical protein
MLPIQNYILAQYKRCATKRGYKFLLEDTEVIKIMSRPCVYCGAMNSNRAVRNQYAVKEYSYNGIDRINSDQDYTISNCAACCSSCNAAKSNMSVVDFMRSEWFMVRITALRNLK